MDTLRIHVKGGTGGAGLPRYGGIGGAGGNIYMVAQNKETLETVLKKLKTKRVKAEDGGDSSARGIIGIPGKDININVPCGITLYNDNGVLLGRYIFSNIIVIACAYQNKTFNE